MADENGSSRLDRVERLLEEMAEAAAKRDADLAATRQAAAEAPAAHDADLAAGPLRRPRRTTMRSAGTCAARST